GGRLIPGPERIPVGANPTSVTLGDLSGDGQPDIATGNRTAGSVTALIAEP
ncbi:MAG: VCBS repeat-containing protein, partial [Polyangiaceae bacterium]|nr:VCBS repeat-containing protein [Polyangiaceae bacterium]